MYVSEAKTIQVLGQEFQSFLTEEGSVVFSQSSVAKGLDISESYARKAFALSSSEKPETLTGYVKSGRTKIKVRSGKSVQHISVVTMTDLTLMVSYLADRDHDRATAMQQASFAIMLQQSVDVAYGTERPAQEYVDRAAELAILVEKTRKELREISGRITNPTIACNLYKVNNQLVYGENVNRDTYEGDDAALKHSKVKSLEMMQAGMKMSGMSLEEIVKLSHEVYLTKLCKVKA
jgi:hypothetical protein